jgi:hypothetical protein
MGAPEPGWPDDPEGAAWFADGAYHLTTREPGHFVAVGVPTPELPGDVRVSARFRKVAGPPGGSYGLILRDQGPGPRDGSNQVGRYYVLEASDTGEVGIWRRDRDRWVDLAPWTSSAALGPADSVNDLVAQALGERLILLVNGREVATARDRALATGNVGVFVGGDLNHVALERLVVEVPGPAISLRSMAALPVAAAHRSETRSELRL